MKIGDVVRIKVDNFREDAREWPLAYVAEVRKGAIRVKFVDCEGRVNLEWFPESYVKVTSR